MPFQQVASGVYTPGSIIYVTDIVGINTEVIVSFSDEFQPIDLYCVWVFWNQESQLNRPIYLRDFLQWVPSRYHVEKEFSQCLVGLYFPNKNFRDYQQNWVAYRRTDFVVP